MKKEMKTTAFVFVCVFFMMTALAQAANQQSTVTDATLKRTRMVEAAIWSAPFAATAYFRDAYFHAAKANYNDVIYMSRPMEPNIQWLTPNQQVLYTAGFMNIKKHGPTVMEVPAKGEMLLFGSFFDAWQVPLEDVGPAGLDGGNGGKYLILPSGYMDPIPSGYFVVKSPTHNVWFNLRVVPPKLDKATLKKAVAYLKQYKIYPLSKNDKPGKTRFIDIADVEFNTLPTYNQTYFKVLSEFLSEETVQDRDKQMMEYLASIGIERGKPFAPEKDKIAMFGQAATDAFNIMEQWLLNDFGRPMYEGSRWLWPSVVDKENNSTYENSVRYLTDRRGVLYYMANHVPKHLGKGTVYIIGFYDDAGRQFRGKQNYHLHVPPNVPAKQFWSLNIYDLKTGAFIKTPQKKVGVSSLDPGLKKNKDGSVDIYFGKDAPKGKENNWIPAGGKDFYPIFRFYGPEPAVFDGSYRLPDVKRVQ